MKACGEQRLLWLVLLVAAVVMAATPAYQRMLQHSVSIRSTFDNLALAGRRLVLPDDAAAAVADQYRPRFAAAYPLLDAFWLVQAFVLLA